MTSPRLQPQYQTWFTYLCRNFVARVKSIPEVAMVAVQPFNDSGLPDFFVLLDDLQPAEESLARYRVTLAVLNLRWQYTNPWLLDYYFLNLQDYRSENADVSWRDFLSPTETVIYTRTGQPFDMRVPYWAGAAAGMFGCACLGLFTAVSNRNGTSNFLSDGLQAILYLLPFLFLAGLISARCTARAFNKANVWSNGEGVFNTWLEAMIESGLTTGGVLGIIVLLPLFIGFQPSLLGGLSNNLPDIKHSFWWELTPPLNLLAYFNSSTTLNLFTGLSIGLIFGFGLALLTGWVVRRWILASPLQASTPLNDKVSVFLLKYLSLAITFSGLFLACYSLWPLPAIYSPRY